MAVVREELIRLEGREQALSYPSDGAWGIPAPAHRRALVHLRRLVDDLERGVHLFDEKSNFGSLVTPVDNERAPIHRWYAYKEAFSYRLPREVLARFGAGRSGLVVDPFGGVATTALSLQGDPRASGVVSIEYSPFAHLVGRAKLSWSELGPARMRLLLRRALAFREGTIDAPELATFHNREVFRPRVLRGLLTARERLLRMNMTRAERDFFLTGLAAVVEDLSGVMKDGRALRILRSRQRKRKHLEASVPVNHQQDPVRHALASQWTAMIEDLERLAPARRRVDRRRARHVRGDARALQEVRYRGETLINPSSVGLFVYSPPYLNCIDYSEVYKLELWLLELVTTQEEFRSLRLGTIRSHPSVEFPARNYLASLSGSHVFEAIEAISSFVERNNVRPQIGRMIWNYFDDMYQVLAEQFEALEPGGHAACVVGNSTFSRRDKTEAGVVERWRLPVLTDVILARLAEEIGFEDVLIWRARELRPRNVNEGIARESVVIARKPG